ncbi:MAG: DUF1749 domain-containing protein [Patescibacteria group bacterium]|nr:DUF1749 domain-containing protein [Patescibacteria group bacterium]
MKQLRPQLTQFKTTDDLLLPGLLYELEDKNDRSDSSGSKRVAINLHGNGSASVFYSVERTQAFAEVLTKAGISFFTFNNRGAHYIKKINVAKDKTKQIQGKESDNYQLQEVKLGTTFEIIKDCQFDINGAVAFLKNKGYEEFYLIGHSTGANKICVYDFYQAQNEIDKYILLGGGDDTGIFFEMMGGDKQQFFYNLDQARQHIDEGRGKELVLKEVIDYMLSYQSFFDICYPDGDYNTFPFREYLQEFKLSKKPLFRYFKKIKKPSLIIYGENDEYTPEGSGKKANQILKKQIAGKTNFSFEVIKNADHSFHGREKELVEIVAAWLAD